MFYYTGQWNFATARKLTHAAAGEDFGFCVSDLIILDTMFYIIRLPCRQLCSHCYLKFVYIYYDSFWYYQRRRYFVEINTAEHREEEEKKGATQQPIQQVSWPRLNSYKKKKREIFCFVFLKEEEFPRWNFVSCMSGKKDWRGFCISYREKRKKKSMLLLK